MNAFIDAFWRAVAYCLHPRVIGLSLLPVVIVVVLAWGLGYVFWDAAVNAVFVWLESSALLSSVGSWLNSMGVGGLKTVVAPLVVIFAITPAVVVLSLLLVALLMMPAVVRLVARRRFETLEQKRGGSFAAGLAWSLFSTLLAAFALVVSVPLWLIPPLILVLPPLIWGWLTYRVMTYDALAEHASAEERQELMRRHRPWLLAIGVISGYLGAAPSVVWASGWIFAAAFMLLIPVAIWIYTLVFAFASLWFAHYSLAALQALRAERAAAAAASAPIPDTFAHQALALPDDQQRTHRD